MAAMTMQDTTLPVLLQPTTEYLMQDAAGSVLQKLSSPQQCHGRCRQRAAKQAHRAGLLALPQTAQHAAVCGAARALPVCPPVDAVKAPRFRRVGSEKDGVWADPVAVHRCRGLQVVDKQQAQFGDHVHQPILVAYLHGYWEVICKLLGEKKLCLALERRLACRAEGRAWGSVWRSAYQKQLAGKTQRWHKGRDSKCQGAASAG